VILEVHPTADEELAAAVEWYEEREPGLGDDFELDVLDAFDLIVARPKAWRPWAGLSHVRVFPLDRFPYLIPYAARENRLIVLAIAHAKRRPGYWISRL
jgi:toxin ParE1/3/4